VLEEMRLSEARLSTARQANVEALFFGDFLLSQQKKVTRPPGRNPGADIHKQPPAKNARHNQQTRTQSNDNIRLRFCV
jgi:hypothetical protein